MWIYFAVNGAIHSKRFKVGGVICGFVIDCSLEDGVVIAAPITSRGLDDKNVPKITIPVSWKEVQYQKKVSHAIVRRRQSCALVTVRPARNHSLLAVLPNSRTCAI